nr:hypothetical protein [uncultured Noviherbaspirillum sp.]
MTLQSHKQIEAACLQLNRSIRLFLEESDYYSAATLAGASEGVLGQIAMLGDNSVNALGTKISSTREMLFAGENAVLDNASLIADFNAFRDWLKHSKVTKDSDGDLYIDAEDAAFELIDRAVVNCILVTKIRTEEMDRFLAYKRARDQ